jgi:hypothetical protein
MSDQRFKKVMERRNGRKGKIAVALALLHVLGNGFLGFLENDNGNSTI